MTRAPSRIAKRPAARGCVCALLLAGALVAAPAAHAEAAADSVRVPPARVRAWQMGLARPDRLEHASLSFTLAAGTGLAGGSRTSAFLVAFAIGTLKELWGRGHEGFDPVDLTADALGAALGARAGASR